jgi:hypothetical protein
METDVQPLAHVAGVLLANIVVNAAEAVSTGRARLASRVSFDGGTIPPSPPRAGLGKR